MRSGKQRSCSRFPFDLNCVAAFSCVYREVTLLNISMHGALIEAQNLAVHFDGPDCTIRIRSDNGHALELAATVVRGDAQNLVALRWARTDRDSQKQLRRLIWKTLRADLSATRGLREHLPTATTRARPTATGTNGPARFGGALVVWEETLFVQGQHNTELN